MLSTFLLNLISIVLCVSATFSLTAAANCHDMEADIIIAIDSSHSLHNHEFQSQLVFVKALIDSFPINSGLVRVGLVSIGSSPKELIPFSDQQNSQKLKIEVNKIKQPFRQGTMTHRAIHKIHHEMFPKGRSWVKHVLVLITDGLSDNLTLTLQEASEAKSNNITIFSIGVGASRRQFEIDTVASQPKEDHIFNVDSYRALESIRKSLVSSICRENKSHEILDTIPECLYKTADVLFLVDSSSSIYIEHFDGLKTLMRNVIESFDIHPNLTRVGLVVYTESPMVIVELDSNTRKLDVRMHVERVPYITGNTDTARGLRYARDKLLRDGKSLRPDVDSILIHVTDGQPDSAQEASEEIHYLESRGVIIFNVLLAENHNSSIAHEHLSSKENNYIIVNESDFSTKHTLVAQRTCSAMPSNMSAFCPEVSTDVVFVYDSSSVDGPHHRFISDVMRAVVGSSGLNGEELRFGVVRDVLKETKSLQDIELTKQWTKDGFKHKLDLDAERAAIDLLLEKVRIRYFPPLTAAKEKKKIVILFLDSNLANDVSAKLEAGRLKSSHVRIVVVVIGKHVNLGKALKLASESCDRCLIHVPLTHSEHARKHVTHQLLLQILCD